MWSIGKAGRLVVGLNKAVDRRLEFPDRSVGIATNLLLGQQGEEALDLQEAEVGAKCRS